MGGGSAQGLDLNVWSTNRVPGAVLGFGDSKKIPDLVGLYFGGERQRRDIIKKETILNCILSQRAVSFTGKKK